MTIGCDAISIKNHITGCTATVVFRDITRTILYTDVYANSLVPVIMPDVVERVR